MIQFCFLFLALHRMRGFLSIDIDINELQVNQCSAPTYLYEYQAIRNGKPVQHDEVFNQMDAFHESHKCHVDSMEVWNAFTIQAASELFSFHNKPYRYFIYISVMDCGCVCLFPYFCSVITGRWWVQTPLANLLWLDGHAALTSVCVSEDFTRFVIRTGSMVPSWKWRTRNIVIISARITRTFFSVPLVHRVVLSAPVHGPVWPLTIGHFGWPYWQHRCCVPSLRLALPATCIAIERLKSSRWPARFSSLSRCSVALSCI